MNETNAMNGIPYLLGKVQMMDQRPANPHYRDFFEGLQFCYAEVPDMYFFLMCISKFPMAIASREEFTNSSDCLLLPGN